MAILLITHDLGVVARLAQRIGVMYAGELVEIAGREQFFTQPAHPYTQALLSAVPSPRLDGGQKIIRLAGETPSPANPPTGCHFHPRCPLAVEECRTTYPQVRQLSASHRVNCDRI
jgi:peptide/nickel transport system ATP-binding protein